MQASIEEQSNAAVRSLVKRCRESGPAVMSVYVFYWVAVGEPSYKMRTALSPTSKMTKLRNSYPEGIACVLLFSSRASFERRKNLYLVGRKTVCAASC